MITKTYLCIVNLFIIYGNQSMPVSLLRNLSERRCYFVKDRTSSLLRNRCPQEVCRCLHCFYSITTYKVSRFSAFTGGLVKLSEWLLLNSCRDVCMESTGKYWIPVFNILEDVCRVTLAHPKYLKAIRGKKTDKKDARWIADLFKHDLVVASFMLPADIRQLRDLMRYRTKLTGFASSEKNRFQNCLTVSNIQIASVVSDTSGVSSMRIIESLLEGHDVSDIESLLHGPMVKRQTISVLP